MSDRGSKAPGRLRVTSQAPSRKPTEEEVAESFLGGAVIYQSVQDRA